MSKFCNARVVTWAHDYGFTDEPTLDYYTIGYMCGKPASNGSCCKSHSSSLPFGRFSKSAPGYALLDGLMDDGSRIKKGDAMCWAFPEPDVDDDGNLLNNTQEPLDDNYWMCEDGWSDDEFSEFNTPQKSKKVSPPKNKAPSISSLRERLENLGLSTSGKKSDLLLRLQNTDNSPKNTQNSSKKTRAPSKYNLFMARELPKYKKKFPNLDHKTCFSQVAAMWSAQKN